MHATTHQLGSPLFLTPRVYTPVTAPARSSTPAKWGAAVPPAKPAKTRRGSHLISTRRCSSGESRQQSSIRYLSRYLQFWQHSPQQAGDDKVQVERLASAPFRRITANTQSNQSPQGEGAGKSPTSQQQWRPAWTRSSSRAPNSRPNSTRRWTCKRSTSRS